VEGLGESGLKCVTSTTTVWESFKYAKQLVSLREASWEGTYSTQNTMGKRTFGKGGVACKKKKKHNKGTKLFGIREKEKRKKEKDR